MVALCCRCCCALLTHIRTTTYCRAAGSYLSAALVSIVQAITTSNGGPGWVGPNVNDSKWG